MMRSLLQVALVVVILVVAGIGTKLLIDSRKPPAKQAQVIEPPLVRVLEVAWTESRLDVETNGTVSPRTDTTLVAQVAGVVTSVSPALVAGGFFAAGDVLVSIDEREYELAVTAARAEVAQRRVAIELERAEAEVAIAQWQALGKGEAPPLARHEPQLAQAQAAFAAAEARLQRTELDLARCTVKAPYAGRVWDKRVDAAQYVAPGTPLARVYAIDAVEIRLPIADADLAFLDLPLGMSDDRPLAKGPQVDLRANFAGGIHLWTGHVVRTEGEIDPRTRMVHAVVRVEDPYVRGENGDARRPPLAVGMFVDATVHGRTVAGVVALPRGALRPGGESILVVDKAGKLWHRKVGVLRLTRTTAYVESGVQAGELVCLTPLEVVVDGMAVRIQAPQAEGKR